MNYTRKWGAAIFLFFLYNSLIGQQPAQSIRGKVVDADTKMGIPGVNVIILNSEPLVGVATDDGGNFKLPQTPIGRVSLKISSLGFEEQVVQNLLVIAGKETVLELELRESFVGMGEVIISSDVDKSQLTNEMALVSARNFTVEETKRFAGSFNDPARMAASYAGVNSDGGGNNDIIVRGNNSRFIQWKLEGIEIPNPNHFGQEGLTGGPISALNSQMLANSEFYTGAFSPSYGNALAGIFDMKLRKGNNEKSEKSFSLGVLGTDMTLEGPFSKKSRASYLINYRYSTLGLLNNLGIVDFSGVPKYQDLSFKFHLPTNSFGTFTLFGLGGKSGLDMEFFEEDNQTRMNEKAVQASNLAIGGINHYLPFGSKILLQNSISYAANGSGFASEVLLNDQEFRKESKGDLRNRTFRAASTINFKFNSRHFAEAGVVLSRFDFDFESRYFDRSLNEEKVNQDHNGTAYLVQAFASWRWRLSPTLTLVNGIHSQKTSQHQALSFEPRSSMRLDLPRSQALTAGIGQHSKMTSLPNYFARIASSQGGTSMPNTGLDLLKARHLVVGYENKLGDQLFLKIEAYHQYLYNIPIEPNSQSSYSLLNQDDLWTDRLLENEGRGENYGMEFTLERFFDDGYYFLITGSVFESTYVAGDKIWRNSRFNGNYMGNLLFGKEFKLTNSTEKVRVLSLNGRTALLGGRRLLPIDVAASVAAERVIYDESRAFEIKNDDIFSLNIAITYRVDKKKFSQEIKLDVQNVTGNAAITDYYWNNTSQKIESIPQLSTLPVLSYTVHF
ncbi:MAG TPA: TonB-dependent receptor [Lunatimonas sp.]|nr:TonB-dependent receptor [Lunatimonas sp.]